MSRRLRSKTSPVELLGEIADQRRICCSWMVVSTYDDAPVYDPATMSCLAYQRERAPVCGPHWQIFASFKRKVRSKQVTQLLGYPVLAAGADTGVNSEGKANRVSCVINFGTPQQAIAYCTAASFCRRCHAGASPFVELRCRDGCDQARAKDVLIGPVLHGTPIQALDWTERHAAVVQKIKEGVSQADLCAEMPAYVVQCSRFVEKAFTLFAPPRRWAPAVFWLHGASGSEKSRLASAVCTDAYHKPPDSKWFDGYDNERVIVMNDLRKGTFTFSYLLELFDRYPLRVEVKGGYRQMRARVMIVTCSKSHAELWAEIAGQANENIAQLSRRITEEAAFPMSLHDKRALLYRMRRAVLAEAVDTADNVYGAWNGDGPVPAPLFGTGATVIDSEAVLPELEDGFESAQPRS